MSDPGGPAAERRRVAAFLCALRLVGRILVHDKNSAGTLLRGSSSSPLADVRRAAGKLLQYAHDATALACGRPSATAPFRREAERRARGIVVR
jgi:hypothetical protein